MKILSIVTCKKCGSSNLEEVKKEVESLNEIDFVTVFGKICIECGCFHYELDGVDIYEYLVEERSIVDATKGYITDYDLKRKNKYEEV